MQTTTQQAQSSERRVVEVQVVVVEVGPRGERYLTRHYSDGNGRVWGRWEAPARPTLRWD